MHDIRYSVLYVHVHSTCAVRTTPTVLTMGYAHGSLGTVSTIVVKTKHTV